MNIRTFSILECEAKFDVATGTENDALQILSKFGKIIYRRKQSIRDVYFDTSDLLLLENSKSFRYRQRIGKKRVTYSYKEPFEISEGGISIRVEFNARTKGLLDLGNPLHNRASPLLKLIEFGKTKGRKANSFSCELKPTALLRTERSFYTLVHQRHPTRFAVFFDHVESRTVETSDCSIWTRRDEMEIEYYPGPPVAPGSIETLRELVAALSASDFPEVKYSKYEAAMLHR